MQTVALFQSIFLSGIWKISFLQFLLFFCDSSWLAGIVYNSFLGHFIGVCSMTLCFKWCFADYIEAAGCFYRASSPVSRGGKIGVLAQSTMSDPLIASFWVFDPSGTDLKLPLLHPHRRRKRQRCSWKGCPCLLPVWSNRSCCCSEEPGCDLSDCHGCLCCVTCWIKLQMKAINLGSLCN